MFKWLLSDHREVEMLRTVDPSLPRPGAFSIGLARSNDEFLAAGRLLYESYQRRGIPFVNEAKIRVIPQLMAPNTAVIIAKSGDTIVGTATVVCRNPFDFPVAEILTPSERADFLSEHEGAVAEIASLAIATDYLAPKSGVFHFLVGYLHHFCKTYLEISKVVIAAQPNVVEYYKAMFGFMPIGDQTKPRKMPSAGNDLTVPLWTTIEKFEQKIVTNAKRVNKLKTLTKLFLEDPKKDPAFHFPVAKISGGIYLSKPVSLIEELFLKQTEIMKNSDPAKRARIEAMYPQTEDFRWVFQNDPRISKRRARRFTVNLPTAVAVRSAGNGTSVRSGTIIDISENGARLELLPNEGALPTMGEITITIPVSETTETSVHGEIVRSEPDQRSYGIQITDCSTSFLEYIRRLSAADAA